MNFFRLGIGLPNGFRKRVCGFHDTKNAASVCDKRPVCTGRNARIENRCGERRINLNGKSFFIGSGISAACQDDAAGAAGGEADFRICQRAVAAGLQNGKKIAFQKRKNHLRFRIAEA